MVVGICRIDLIIPESESLKAKRGVVKAALARIRHKFDVAAAEVGGQDSWQRSEIGVACLSSNARHANEVLSHVVDFAEGLALDLQVAGYEIEIIHAL